MEKIELVITAPIDHELHQQLGTEESISSEYVGEMNVAKIVELIRGTAKIVVTADYDKAHNIWKQHPRARIIDFDLSQLEQGDIIKRLVETLGYEDTFKPGDIIRIPTPKNV